MRRSKRGIALGAALCVLTLVVSVLLQKAGYLIYLNSDMASEIILANRQAQTHSLVQMDWLYSTEIHSVHMNLFYALAFVFTPSYEAARIIGNTLVFVMGMAACAGLCSACGLSLGASLCAAAMLPLAASTVYAENMTVGGYYIIHLVFGFWGAALWLKAARQRRKRNTAAFAAICLVEGLCSVRYVLCFLCPMVVVAGLDWLLSSGRRTLRDTHTRFLGVTLAGWVMPRRKWSIRGCLSAASAGRARLCSTRWTARQWGRRFGRSSRISSSSSAGGAGRHCFRRRAQPTC